MSKGKASEQKRSEVLQGTLDLMVLKTLDAMGPLHGYGIARRIEQFSEDVLQLNEGRFTLLSCACTAGLDLVELGRLRKQSQGKVLFHFQSRAQAACRGDGKLAAHFGRYRQNLEAASAK